MIGRRARGCAVGVWRRRLWRLGWFWNLNGRRDRQHALVDAAETVTALTAEVGEGMTVAPFASFETRSKVLET